MFLDFLLKFKEKRTYFVLIFGTIISLLISYIINSNINIYRVLLGVLIGMFIQNSLMYKKNLKVN